MYSCKFYPLSTKKNLKTPVRTKNVILKSRDDVFKTLRRWRNSRASKYPKFCITLCYDEGLGQPLKSKVNNTPVRDQLCPPELLRGRYQDTDRPLLKK